ncbi:MAG: DUF5752 family protein [Candidatus Woesearchaeota archaeon]
MINVPHDKEFIFQDGNSAKNILELVSTIEKLSDHEFHHFVNVHKNDFANWTDQVLFDKHLSDKLRAVHTKSETLDLLKDKINDVVTSRMEGHSLHDVLKTPQLEYHRDNDNDRIKSDTHQERHSRHGFGHSIIRIIHPNKPKDSLKEGTKKGVDDSIVSVSKDENSEKNKEENKDKKEERAKEKKAGKMWFKLLSKKSLSVKNLENLENKEESKLRVEKELKEELRNDEHENALWVILYIALVVLIITLLIYRLFL